MDERNEILEAKELHFSLKKKLDIIKFIIKVWLAGGDVTLKVKVQVVLEDSHRIWKLSI